MDSSNDGPSARIDAVFRRTGNRPGRLAYGLSVEVESSEGMPPEVFVYHRSAPQLASGLPWDGKVVETFQNVATPVEMFEVPAESEAPAGAPYVRSRSMKAVFRNVFDMDRAADGISEDLAALVKSWENVAGEESYDIVERKTYTNAT